MSDALLASLGFPEWIAATGRQSVADLYKPRRRCGIYVLGFANGERYVGQAVDVVRRFTQHRKTHADITSITFQPVAQEKLNSVETHCIHVLEADGVHLRNIAQMSVIQGERDLDLVVTPEEQDAWLQDAGALTDATDHVQDDSLRRRLAPRLDQLRKLDLAEEALGILGFYLLAAIPAPRRTELTFWMVSCLPYGVKEEMVILRVSLNMQETFTLLRSGDELWGSFHLARTPFEREYGEDWRKILEKQGYEVSEHAYRPGGHDQFNLIAWGAEAIIDCISDQVCNAAMALLNLRLMRKGAIYYGSSHCLDLVDAAFETFERLGAATSEN